MLLGVDVGTTHCKAALVDHNGAIRSIARRATPTRHHADGTAFYDPDELWSTVAATIREVAIHAPPAAIEAIGVASMAETGLLLDPRTGGARTAFVPWFDTAARPQSDQIKGESDLFERFCATGQHPSFKSALAKLLHLRSQQPDLIDGAAWLSTADYVVYRLTGALATDQTLAARTYAFRLDRRAWDDDWLRQWGFNADLFPHAHTSGAIVGAVAAHVADRIELAAGTPVAIGGHDHVCAALAVGALQAGTIFDSIGTAETLIGTLAARALGRMEYESGLTYGPFGADRLYWMGGLSAAGGSIEWLRSLLGDPPLSYADLDALVTAAGSDPTAIIYVPYLLGSGTPHPDPLASGAFVGLNAAHTRSDIAKALLEGTAYELEFIRRAAQQAVGTAIETVLAAGGGTRNRPWMQIKADVSGCRYNVTPIDEAALLGAALLAGIGCGAYRDAADAATTIDRAAAATYQPDHARHTMYRRLYETGYLPLQQPLREVSHNLAKEV